MLYKNARVSCRNRPVRVFIVPQQKMCTPRTSYFEAFEEHSCMITYIIYCFDVLRIHVVARAESKPGRNKEGLTRGQ